MSGKAKDNVRLFEPTVKEQIHLDKDLITMPLASRSLLPRVSLVKGEITITETKIFDKTIYQIEPWCRSLPGQPCSFVLEADDQEWYDIEIDSADIDFSSVAPVTPRMLLSPRRVSPKFMCGGVATPYSSKSYPGPKTAKDNWQAGGVHVPIMLPTIKCDSKLCPADNWAMESRTDHEVVEIPEGEDAKRTIWSSKSFTLLNDDNRGLLTWMQWNTSMS